MIVDQSGERRESARVKVERHKDTLRARFAIVVGADITDDHAFGMARMYEMLLEAEPASLASACFARQSTPSRGWGLKTADRAAGIGDRRRRVLLDHPAL